MMMPERRATWPLLCLLGLFLWLTSTVSVADEDGDPSSISFACDNAQVFERMFTNICWSCIVPMKIAGQDFGGNAPSGASSSPLCMCNPPFPGLTVGMWQPARLIELVREPGCSPTFGGTDLGLGDEMEKGGHKSTGRAGHPDSTFRHAHYFSFPLGEMLGLIQGCEDFSDFDLLYVTELMATWNDDELALLSTPEAAAFANPQAFLACQGEAATTGAAGQEPQDDLFWCAGSWGHIYPLTGNIYVPTSPPRDTSLMATKLIAQLHRWGMAQKTMGNYCGGEIHPMIPKSQYKLAQYYPVPESSNKHWIGESTFRWGEHRNVPGDEDYLHLIYRWNDCCVEP